MKWIFASIVLLFSLNQASAASSSASVKINLIVSHQAYMTTVDNKPCLRSSHSGAAYKVYHTASDGTLSSHNIVDGGANCSAQFNDLVSTSVGKQSGEILISAV